MMRRILAATASAALGLALFVVGTPAQAASPDEFWLGYSSGLEVADNPYANGKVTLLAHGSTVLLAYREFNSLVITSSSDSPSSLFEEWARIDTTGKTLLGKPRLDSVSDGSVVVSFLVRESDTQSVLRVIRFDGSGRVQSDSSVSQILTAEGFDLGISDSGEITTVYADEASNGEIRIQVSTIRDGIPRQTPLAVAPAIGSPRIVVGSDGRAVVMWEQRNDTNDTVRLWSMRRPTGNGNFGSYSASADGRPVTTWDIDGDASGYFSVFVQDAATESLFAFNGEIEPAVEYAPFDEIREATENLQWLSVEVTNAFEKTYFYNNIRSNGVASTYSFARSIRNPESGVLKLMFSGIPQNPNYARVSGVDSEGMPWTVSSTVGAVGEVPRLSSATYSVNPDGASIDRLGRIVGTAVFGITTADAVALDNGSMVSAWIALVDGRNSLRVRWRAPAVPDRKSVV